MHKVGWWWLPRQPASSERGFERVSVCGIPFFVKWKKSGWSIEKNDNTGEWNSRLADEAGFIPRCCCIKKTSMPTLQTLSYRRESRSKKGSVVRPLTAAVVALLLFSRRSSSSTTNIFPPRQSPVVRSFDRRSATFISSSSASSSPPRSALSSSLLMLKWEKAATTLLLPPVFLFYFQALIGTKWKDFVAVAAASTTTTRATATQSKRSILCAVVSMCVLL